MEKHDLDIIYEQLKDKYDLVLTNTFSLENGIKDYGDNFPILCGASALGQFQLFHNGLYFIFDVDKADGSYTHVHPYDITECVTCIIRFMNEDVDWMAFLGDS